VTQPAANMNNTTTQTVVIKPSKGWASLRLAELWRFRELFYFLAWRDIKVRYKQTVLGIAWAIINPLTQMVTWAFIFGKVAKLPSEGIPYILITLTGTLVWNYFSEIVNGSGNSVVNNANLVSKIYFPRLIIPLSVVLRGLLDFSVALAMATIIMFYFKITPHLTILFLPLFILLATVIAVGVGLWASAVSVKYRDVAKILPYLIQLWFFLTPVAYLNSVVPQKYQWLYHLNPIAGAIEGFRWVLLGTPISWNRLLISSLVALFIFITGIFYFRRLERTFADVI
jgi:lipopolysaccharide transport system permease protein